MLIPLGRNCLYPIDMMENVDLILQRFLVITILLMITGNYNRSLLLLMMARNN